MSYRYATRLCATLAWASACAYGAGDSTSNTPAMDPSVVVPPAPVLTAEQALTRLKAAAGLRVELAAGEPQVVAPVAALFDADGRLWVCEMRGYMPNVDAKGERDPVGAIAVLEDVDGDGRFEKRTEFMGGLSMPRAIAFAGDGLLVAEPPTLWFCRDADGDLKADGKEQVTKYGGTVNPEHTSNGLLRAIDNWLYNANHGTRLRFVDGKFAEEPAPGRGQWGLGQDNRGRLFTSTNSAALLADGLPAWAFDAGAAKTVGIAKAIAAQAPTFPIRPTPGVNRGYMKTTLRPDGTLARVTAACGSNVYRGDLMADAVGDAFTCEPAGNLVLRFKVSTEGLAAKAKPAYDKTEFLASLDERFRPVNCLTGPDGALYIVDLARGILQHKTYLTTYLKGQIAARGLDQGLEQGRVWRVLPAGAKRGARPQLSKAPAAELVKQLGNPNGWWRDTAQRLLTERKMQDAAPALRALLKSGPPIARFHALWTLEGLGALDEEALADALASDDATTRAAGVRLALRPSVKAPAAAAKALTMHGDGDPLVQAALAASLVGRKDGDAGKALAALGQSSVPTVKALAAWARDGKAAAPIEESKPQDGEGN